MHSLSSMTVSASLVLTLACSTSVVAGEPNSNTATPAMQNDNTTAFLSTILASTEDFWGATFKADGLTYEEPKLVLFSGMIGTDCGVVSGSSYCAKDHKIYVDPTFAELHKIGANGELAQALIITREVAYHVQNIAAEMVRSASEQAAPLGLQADCFIGLWSQYARDQGLLKDDDLTVARDLLPRLGDEQIAGPASDLRVWWFNRGLAGKGMADCNTFGGPP